MSCDNKNCNYSTWKKTPCLNNDQLIKLRTIETSQQGINSTSCDTNQNNFIDSEVCIYPNNCELSDWTSWTPCSSGKQIKTRQIKNPPKIGGDECPNSLKAYFESQNCTINNTTNGVCTYTDWSEWSPCSNIAGLGYQVRTRGVETAGANCSNKYEDYIQKQSCNIGTNNDCILSDWSWSPCSTKCGNGFKIGTRTVLENAKNGGKTCPMDKNSYYIKQDCSSNEYCPVDCIVSDWTSCNSNFIKTRNFTPARNCGICTQEIITEEICFPEITGLYARYTGDGPFTKSGDNITVWNDIGGSNRHITTYRGIPKQVSISKGLYGTTGKGSFNVVKGTINDGFKLPFALPQNNNPSVSSYTIAYIARYTGDRNNIKENRRIFDSTASVPNHLWGFHGNINGRTHNANHGWITETFKKQSEPNYWMIGVETELNSRFNGIDWTINPKKSTTTPTFSINFGNYSGDGTNSSETSNWEVAELIFYNREISLNERISLENFLALKYGHISFSNVATTLENYKLLLDNALTYKYSLSIKFSDMLTSGIGDITVSASTISTKKAPKPLVIGVDIPSGVTSITVKMWGAGGGGGVYLGVNPVNGSPGGYVTGTINGLVDGDIIYIYTGQRGLGNRKGNTIGGWPAGGSLIYSAGQAFGHGGSGGGRSQISIYRSNDTFANPTFSNHSNILMVSGGGGGSTLHGNTTGTGGAGGGIVGNNNSNNTVLGGNNSGTNTSTNFLTGINCTRNWSAAGGDGFFGGNATTVINSSFGGGGGSSYIANYTINNKLFDRIYITNSSTETGVNSGNPPNFTDNFNNSLYGKGGNKVDTAYSVSGTEADAQDGLVHIEWTNPNNIPNNNIMINIYNSWYNIWNGAQYYYNNKLLNGPGLGEPVFINNLVYFGRLYQNFDINTVRGYDNKNNKRITYNIKTIPNALKIHIVCCGGGGGGGGGNSTGGGGGAGGMSYIANATNLSNLDLTLVIGARGELGAYTWSRPNRSASGGDTTVSWTINNVVNSLTGRGGYEGKDNSRNNNSDGGGYDITNIKNTIGIVGGGNGGKGPTRNDNFQSKGGAIFTPTNQIFNYINNIRTNLWEIISAFGVHSINMSDRFFPHHLRTGNGGVANGTDQNRDRTSWGFTHHLRNGEAGGAGWVLLIYDNNIQQEINYITVYEHYDYQGVSSNLTVGFYNISQMGIANDVISSVKVPPGFKVTLYEHDINWYGGGRTYVLTANVPNLGNVWLNDVVSSIKVEKI